MEKALLDIAEQLKTIEYLDDKALTKVINRNNKRILEEERARAATEESRARTAATAEAPANREIGTTTAPEELRSEASLAGQPELAPADREPTASTAPAYREPTPQTLDKTGAKINPARPLSKRHLIAYYLDVKRNDPEHWARWNFTEEQQRRIERTLQMKPRRTASGVATITVLTKPWKCSSDCLYCPNDLRMPKSYLSDEPACQRAERTFLIPTFR